MSYPSPASGSSDPEVPAFTPEQQEWIRVSSTAPVTATAVASGSQLVTGSSTAGHDHQIIPNQQQAAVRGKFEEEDDEVKSKPYLLPNGCPDIISHFADVTNIGTDTPLLESVSDSPDPRHSQSVPGMQDETDTLIPESTPEDLSSRTQLVTGSSAAGHDQIKPNQQQAAVSEILEEDDEVKSKPYPLPNGRFDIISSSADFADGQNIGTDTLLLESVSDSPHPRHSQNVLAAASTQLLPPVVGQITRDAVGEATAGQSLVTIKKLLSGLSSGVGAAEAVIKAIENQSRPQYAAKQRAVAEALMILANDDDDGIKIGTKWKNGGFEPDVPSNKLYNIEDGNLVGPHPTHRSLLDKILVDLDKSYMDNRQKILYY